jgi:O-antigen/teichoic acid export membrane protein
VSLLVDKSGLISVMDTEKKRLFPNASFAVLQVLVTSATLFVLYRYLLSTQGVDALGVWSLVVAATSLASVSNLGLAGGTVRFVSKYLAHRDERSAAEAVETATLSVAVVMGVTVLIIWPASGWLLSLVVPHKWLGVAHALLPYTLTALWLNSTGGAIHSGLDGCHRADRRSLATMLAQPLLLLLTVSIVPSVGLLGLAYAQVLQYLFWATLGWFLLRKELPALSLFPSRWSRKLFREMWRYGLNFQIIAILGMLAEPVLKGLISHFGTLGAVGYYEMANRLIGQVRSLLVSANQVFIPYYSKMKETAYDEIAGLYQENLSTIVLIGSLLISSVVALLPAISLVWIGHLEPQFLLFGVVLAAGWFANILAVPAYFANLGGGWISRNLYCQVTQTVSVVTLGTLGGSLWGATGTVMAWPVALVLGAMVVTLSFQRAEKIPMSIVFSPVNTKAIGLGVAIAVSGFGSYGLVSTRAGEVVAAICTVLVLLVGWGLFYFVVPGSDRFLQTVGKNIGLRRAQ